MPRPKKPKDPKETKEKDIFGKKGRRVIRGGGSRHSITGGIKGFGKYTNDPYAYNQDQQDGANFMAGASDDDNKKTDTENINPLLQRNLSASSEEFDDNEKNKDSDSSNKDSKDDDGDNLSKRLTDVEMFLQYGMIDDKGNSKLSESQIKKFTIGKSDIGSKKSVPKTCSLINFVAQLSQDQQELMRIDDRHDPDFIGAMIDETDDWSLNYGIDDLVLTYPESLDEITNDEKSFLETVATNNGINLQSPSIEDVNGLLDMIDKSRKVRYRFMIADQRFNEKEKSMLNATALELVKKQLDVLKNSNIINKHELDNHKVTVSDDLKNGSSGLFRNYTLDIFSTDSGSDIHSFVRSSAFKTILGQLKFVGFDSTLIKNQFFTVIFKYLCSREISSFSKDTDFSELLCDKTLKRNFAAISRTIATQVITLLMVRGTNFRKYKNGVNGSLYCTNLIKILFTEFGIYPKNVQGSSSFLSYSRISSAFPIISCYVRQQIPIESSVVDNFPYLPMFAQHTNFTAIVPVNFTDLILVCYVWNLRFSEIINRNTPDYTYSGSTYLAISMNKAYTRFQKVWYLRKLLYDFEIDPHVLTTELNSVGAVSTLTDDQKQERAYIHLTTKLEDKSEKTKRMINFSRISKTGLLSSPDFKVGNITYSDPHLI